MQFKVLGWCQRGTLHILALVFALPAWATAGAVTLDQTHIHHFHILVFLEYSWNYWAQNVCIPNNSTFPTLYKVAIQLPPLLHKKQGKRLAEESIYLSTLSFLYSCKSEVSMFPVCIYTIYSQLGKFKWSIKGFCTNPYYNGVHRNWNSFYHFFSKAIFTKKWNANILDIHLMKGCKIKQLKHNMKWTIK